ncbi:hypothetical protein [Urechidicola sp. KH5]
MLIETIPFNTSAGKLKRLLEDDEKTNTLKDSMKTESFSRVLKIKYIEALKYAKKLTNASESLSESDIAVLKIVNLSDREILDNNQVKAYFNYANRKVLGSSTKGDILGLSPNDSKDKHNWNHQ